MAKNKDFLYRAFGIGVTPKEAEKELSDNIKDSEQKFGIELDNEVERTYSVLFHRTKSPGDTNLESEGSTYEEATKKAEEDFEIDLSKFNQTITINVAYSLSPKEGRKVQKKSTTAGHEHTEKTMRYIL